MGFGYYNQNDVRKNTPLHKAAEHGLEEIVEIMLNEYSYLIDKNPKDSYGRTPLHLAAAAGHAKVCKMILAATGDKNPKNRIGHTPLHLAAENDHEEIMRMIGIEIENRNPENNRGVTPFSLARKHCFNKKGETDYAKLKELESLFQK